MFAPIDPIVGLPQMGLGNLSNDTAVRLGQGFIIQAQDPWWGGAELVWGRATAAIRAQGLCSILPVFDSALQAWRYDVTEVANTANLGRALAVSLGSFSGAGVYGWFLVSGVIPVNCNASVAADTTFGIAAAGQGGANGAGKQVLNARIVAAAAATVVKAGCLANNASKVLTVPNSNGWFVGAYLSGTGIAAATTISSIDASGRIVTLSTDTTAAVNGSVTATYNNATVYYNVAHLNRPFAQGAIT